MLGTYIHSVLWLIATCLGCWGVCRDRGGGGNPHDPREWSTTVECWGGGRMLPTPKQPKQPKQPISSPPKVLSSLSSLKRAPP